jgi:DNA-binding winged helix-turn-helix (wHTH) protein
MRCRVHPQPPMDNGAVDTPRPDRALCCTSFGRYRLFPSRRRLERSGQPIELGSRAFDLLCVLIDQAGEIVTRRELMSRVWGKTVVGEGSLRFHINALRQALAQEDAGTPYIKNVARRGYAFVAPIQRHTDEPGLRERFDLVRFVDLESINDASWVASAVTDR